MSQLPSDALLDDIETLFCAVSARLQRIASGPTEPVAAPTLDVIECLRANLRDCVTALDQLHSMLSLEIEHRNRPVPVIGNSRAALASAPPELEAILDTMLAMPPIDRMPAHAT